MQVPWRILKRDGYHVEKTRAFKSTDDLISVTSDLTARPKGHPNYPQPPAFNCFFEQSGYFVVPRWYGVDRWGQPDRQELGDHPNTKFEFNGALQAHQVDPCHKVLAHLRGPGTGMLSLATGRGKTFCALWLMAQLKQTTLVLCHKSVLMDQWCEEITKWMPGVGVGRVQASKRDFQADVVVATIQTMLNLDTTQVPDRFGFVIVDEVHHIGAAQFNKVFRVCNAKIALGLSATPFRSDGLTNVIQNQIGPIVYRDNVFDAQRVGELLVVQHDSPGASRTAGFADRIQSLVSDDCRTRRIARIITDIIGLEPKRKVLVMSDRKAHLDSLKGELRGVDAGLFTGSQKTAELELTKQCPVILSTYSMFGEGISLPDLNTLVLATPKREIVQVIGRIFRKEYSPDEPKPLIVDIVDTGFHQQHCARLRQYRKEIPRLTIREST